MCGVGDPVWSLLGGTRAGAAAGLFVTGGKISSVSCTAGTECVVIFITSPTGADMGTAPVIEGG